jgi:WD40 repeat protein
MKKIFLFLLPVVLFSCRQDEKPLREVKQYSIEQFYKTKRINGGAFSPDEKSLLVSSDESGIFNAWEIPVDGGSPVQLTNSSGNSIFAISYFPAISVPSMAVTRVETKSITFIYSKKMEA